MKVTMERRSHVIIVGGDNLTDCCNLTEEFEFFSYNFNVTQLRMDPNFIR